MYSERFQKLSYDFTIGSLSHGRGSTPMVPFWGRCTTHFSQFQWGLGSLGVRGFDPLATWTIPTFRFFSNKRGLPKSCFNVRNGLSGTVASVVSWLSWQLCRPGRQLLLGGHKDERDSSVWFPQGSRNIDLFFWLGENQANAPSKQFVLVRP